MVCCAKFSELGLIAADCLDGIRRVYEKEPLFSSLRWSAETLCIIYSVASNYIATLFESCHLYAVQVWDASFQTIFKLQEESVHCILKLGSGVCCQRYAARCWGWNVLVFKCPNPK